MTSDQQTVQSDIRRRRSPRSKPGASSRASRCRSSRSSACRTANLALVRPDRGSGRAGSDAGPETSDRSLAGLVPDEPAHRVDHPHGQSRGLRTLRDRGGSGAAGCTTPGGPSGHRLARVPGRPHAPPVLPVASRAGLPGDCLPDRPQADEANRGESSRVSAAGGAHLASDRAGRRRSDRVLDWVSICFARRRAAASRLRCPPEVRTAPNVLLVVLDTVRADHLSLYGYGRETSPNLSRLARRGVTFEQARSTAPWTLPSHASMMTGRWPHELSTGINGPLDETHRTLAESLAAQGYATAGFVANATYCGIETGLGRGFAHFEDHELSLADVLWTSALGQRVILQATFPPERRARGNPNDYHRKDAASIRRDMLAWVLRQGDRPFFAFLNLYDAHDPYIPPADFQRRFSSGAGSAADMAILERWFISDKKKLTSREIQFVLDAYDDGIAYLDEQLGLPLRRSGADRPAGQHAGDCHGRSRGTSGRAPALRTCQQPLRRGDPRPAADLSSGWSTRRADGHLPGQPPRSGGHRRRPVRPGGLAISRAVARSVLDMPTRRLVPSPRSARSTPR